MHRQRVSFKPIKLARPTSAGWGLKLTACRYGRTPRPGLLSHRAHRYFPSSAMRVARAYYFILTLYYIPTKIENKLDKVSR